MKKLIKIAVTVLVTAAMLATVLPASAASFSDTKGHWAEKQIDRWSDYGVVSGVGDGKFNPNGILSRGQAAKIFAGLLSLSEKADISAYTDVKKSDWFYEPVAQCVKAGIINGRSATTIDPNGTVDRETFFVMFARALGIKGESECTADLVGKDALSSWAKELVFALINHGYVGGTDKGLEAKTNINRASVMALLDKSIKSYEKGGKVQIAADGTITIAKPSETPAVVTPPAGTGSSSGSSSGGGGSSSGRSSGGGGTGSGTGSGSDSEQEDPNQGKEVDPGELGEGVLIDDPDDKQKWSPIL